MSQSVWALWDQQWREGWSMQQNLLFSFSGLHTQFCLIIQPMTVILLLYRRVEKLLSGWDLRTTSLKSCGRRVQNDVWRHFKKLKLTGFEWLNWYHWLRCLCSFFMFVIKAVVPLRVWDPAWVLSLCLKHLHLFYQRGCWTFGTDNTIAEVCICEGHHVMLCAKVRPTHQANKHPSHWY